MSLHTDDVAGRLHTATIFRALGTGGLAEDVLQLEAEEDRRIVAVQGGKNSNNGFVELSTSSAANIGNPPKADADRSGTIFTLGGNGEAIEFGSKDGSEQYVEWDENQELHLHGVNNTGGGIDFAMTVYYLEERDC